VCAGIGLASIPGAEQFRRGGGDCGTDPVGSHQEPSLECRVAWAWIVQSGGGWRPGLCDVFERTQAATAARDLFQLEGRNETLGEAVLGYGPHDVP